MMRLQTIIIAGVGVLVGSGLIMVWLLFNIIPLPTLTGGHTPSRTTDTYSTALATDADKIAFLQQYLTLPSPIAATEFHIVYHDNMANGVPGPSDWDMQVAIKVAPSDLPRWTAGMEQIALDKTDLAWGYALLPQEGRWAIATQPALYRRAGTIMAVFEREGIIFKRVWTT
jgi:hypothetical protein